MEKTTINDIAALKVESALSSTQTRRQALRDFQQALAQKTQQAQSKSAKEDLRLAVQTGDLHWLIQLSHSKEVIALNDLCTVPWTQDWFLGLVHHRGHMMGVIDLPGFMGKPVAPLAASDRLLLLSESLNAPCALRLSKLNGMVNLAELSTQTASAEVAAWMGKNYLDREGQSWRAIDLQALTHEPTFLEIGVH